MPDRSKGGEERRARIRGVDENVEVSYLSASPIGSTAIFYLSDSCSPPCSSRCWRNSAIVRKAADSRYYASRAAMQFRELGAR